MGKGSIQLILDKPYYIAGEVVTGNCQLVLTENVITKDLTIKWKGMERTKFVIQRTVTRHDPATNTTKTEIVYDKYDQEKTFFKTQLCLANFNGGTAMAGSYSFPFQFQLPDNLPGNFNDHRSSFGNSYRGAIVYKVKSNLDNVYAKDIKDTRYLVIVPRSWTIPQPIKCHNEKSFLFGGSGKLYMDVEILKNVFVPGEVIPIRCIVDNQSKKDVDKLKIKLMKDVTMHAKGQTHTYTEEVNRNIFEGVPKKSKFDKVLNYSLPQQIYPSTQGTIVSCKYHLDVECDVAMAFDLEVHPQIEVIFMPAPGQPVYYYNDMTKGCWK
nr:unnamed protein product [Naegleria fowleri]